MDEHVDDDDDDEDTETKQIKCRLQWLLVSVISSYCARLRTWKTKPFATRRRPLHHLRHHRIHKSLHFPIIVKLVIKLFRFARVSFHDGTSRRT